MQKNGYEKNSTSQLLDTFFASVNKSKKIEKVTVKLQVTSENCKDCFKLIKISQQKVEKESMNAIKQKKNSNFKEKQ